MPVSLDDETAIAAALHVVCAAAGVAKSGPLRRVFLQVVRLPRLVLTGGGRECGGPAGHYGAALGPTICAAQHPFSPHTMATTRFARSGGPPLPPSPPPTTMNSARSRCVMKCGDTIQRRLRGRHSSPRLFCRPPRPCAIADTLSRLWKKEPGAIRHGISRRAPKGKKEITYVTRQNMAIDKLEGERTHGLTFLTYAEHKFRHSQN